LFHPISRNEREITLQQDFDLLNEQAENERSRKPMAKKRPMGRPRKLTTTLQSNGNIKKEVDDEAPKGLKASKQGKYINWF
jgi:hypothetical protein